MVAFHGTRNAILLSISSFFSNVLIWVKPHGVLKCLIEYQRRFVLKLEQLLYFSRLWRTLLFFGNVPHSIWCHTSLVNSGVTVFNSTVLLNHCPYGLVYRCNKTRISPSLWQDVAVEHVVDNDGVAHSSSVDRVVGVGGGSVYLHLPAAVLDPAPRLQPLLRHGDALFYGLALRERPRRVHGLRRLLPPRQHSVGGVAGCLCVVWHWVCPHVSLGLLGVV